MHEDEESDGNDVDVGTSLVDERKFQSKIWREYVSVSVYGVAIKGEYKYCNANIGDKCETRARALCNHLWRCKEEKKTL